ncbi:hypothetical protein D3C71_1104270 [compost metagenome]
MVAVAAELAQQVMQALGLRHEDRGAQQRTQIEFRSALELEKVLGQQDADDVFALALVNGEA